MTTLRRLRHGKQRGKRRRCRRPTILALAALCGGGHGVAALYSTGLEGLEGLKREVAPNDDSFSAQILLSIGDRAFARQDYVTSVAAYREVFGAPPNLTMTSVGAWQHLSQNDIVAAALRLAESLLSLRASGQASRWYEVALALSDAGPVHRSYVLERLGDAHFQMMHWDRAATLFRQASQMAGGSETERTAVAATATSSSFLVGDAMEVCLSVDAGGLASCRSGHIAAIHRDRQGSGNEELTDWGERDLHAQHCYVDGATGMYSLPVGSICVTGTDPNRPQGDQQWSQWASPTHFSAGLAWRLPLRCKQQEAEEKGQLFESAGQDWAGAAGYMRLFMPDGLQELWRNSSVGSATGTWRGPSPSTEAAEALLNHIRLPRASAAHAPSVFAEHGAVVLEHAVDSSNCAALAAYLLRFRSARSTRAWEVRPEWRNHSTYFVKANVDRDHFTLSLEEGPDSGPTVGAFLRSLLFRNSATEPLVRSLFSNQSVLWELAAFVAHPGAEAQPLHADVDVTSVNSVAPRSVSLQVLLSDVRPRQGGLVVWPGSHSPGRKTVSSAERNWAQRNAAAAAAVLADPASQDGVRGVARGESDSDESAASFSGVELAPLSAGSVVAYHSGLWHRGGANEQDTPRVVLYLSLLSGGSPERMERAGNSLLVDHHMALIPEYKRRRLRLADIA
eukprot:TRINITY_DN25854_c0_g1_i1.p1 TRINITY_DN25854_c0_g1~~TRINITY_DN25854_c0_g1_i1.p1  ORF type:complete len:710 (+),score=88.79 TRINITY_DN25854_c0_g1_i1:99-2132(+)